MSAQFVPLIGQVIDRALLTGIIVRQLGVESFERWSLILATTSLLTMLDLGTQTTFFNRMSRAANTGDEHLAARIYRESNTIFVGLGGMVLVGTVVFVTSIPVQHFLGFSKTLSPSEQLVALLLGSSIAVKMVVSNSNGVYRANHAYATGTLILSLADLARSFFVVGALLVSPTLIAPAAATLFASIVLSLVFILYDLRKRFPLFSYGLAWPTRVTTERGLRDTLFYASGFLPTIVLTQIPILIIGGRAATGALASFLLMRTFTSLLRSIVLRFANVLGMELGKLEAQHRRDEMRELYSRSTHVACYLFGLATGISLVWGDVLIQLWTGSNRLFDPMILAIMLAPLVLTPRTQIALPFVTYAHRPGRLAVSVISQTVLAGLLAVFLPIDNLALRLAIAIYGAEILSLPPLLYPAVARSMGVPIFGPAVADIVRSGGLAIASYYLGSALRDWWPGRSGMIVSTLLIGALALPLFYVAIRPIMERAGVGR